MKTLFLSFAVSVLLNLSGYSQTFEVELTGRDTVYEAKYNKLREVYVKKRLSESYVAFSKVHKAFLEKVNFNDHFKEIEMRTIMEWVKANLGKTKFATYEEAEKEWEAVRNASQAHGEDASEFYAMMREYRANGDMDIVKDVMKDVAMEYSERP